MDYKELLRKYIEHVGDVEGTYFISSIYRDSSMFSEEEWNELIKISNSIN